MSAAKTAIEAIKKLLKFEVEPPAPAPVDPPAPTEQEYTCADGSKVKIDKMEVGGKVVKDGEAVADGDLTLEDGKVLSVVGGLISAITEPTPATEEPLETPEQMRAVLQKFEEDATTPDMQKMVVIVKALFERSFGWEIREAQEKALRDQAIAAYKTGFSKQQEALTKLVELVEAIAEQPIAEPLEKPANWDEMTPLQRFRAAKSMFANQ